MLLEAAGGRRGDQVVTWCRALLTELLTPVALQVQAHLAALAVLLSLKQTLQQQQLLLPWSSVRD